MSSPIPIRHCSSAGSSENEKHRCVLFQDVLATLGSPNFHEDFRIGLPISRKGANRDFGRDCVQSVDHLGSTAIVTMSSSLINEHGMSFHLVRSL